MKPEEKNKQQSNELKKKKYEKPQIIHTSKIETLAGSCGAEGGCSPAYS